MSDKKMILSLECDAVDTKHIVRIWQLLNADELQGANADISLEEIVCTLWYLRDFIRENHYFDEHALTEHVKKRLLQWHPDFFDEE